MQKHVGASAKELVNFLSAPHFCPVLFYGNTASTSACWPRISYTTTGSRTFLNARGPRAHNAKASSSSLTPVTLPSQVETNDARVKLPLWEVAGDGARGLGPSEKESIMRLTLAL
jgi:hypothetical protein